MIVADTPSYSTHPAQADISVVITSSLALGSTGQGINIDTASHPNYSGSYLSSTGNTGANYTPTTNTFTNKFLTTPTNINADGCPWIPDSSNLKGQGASGSDLGATILYRYEDGVLTSTPLWDSDGTGALDGIFPACGPIVTGINDVANDSCSTVHNRFNVNGTNCAFPSGYGDSTAPTAGNSGTITTSGVGAAGLTLNWTAGTDAVTAQASLVYAVYQSSANNISSVANMEANGTLIMSYTANTVTKAVTGLLASTTYYFNVIVKDEAGNKTAYTTKSETTTSAAPPPPRTFTRALGLKSRGQ
jgi:hypothetical protein